MQEKRRYVRRRESLQMSIKPDTGDTKTFTTRDVSNGGIFLIAMASEQLPVGTEVIITPVQPTAGIPPSAIKGRVVRVSPQGMGIEFLK
jgi:c-di-GMP-binding flagellar brake protein YcgR